MQPKTYDVCIDGKFVEINEIIICTKLQNITLLYNYHVYNDSVYINWIQTEKKQKHIDVHYS